MMKLALSLVSIIQVIFQNKKITSANIIVMWKIPISWNSKKQSLAVTSIAKIEKISASLCIKKKLFRIKNILYELFKYNKPLILFTDNNSR